MSKEYICDKIGITGTDMVLFVDLIADFTEEQKQESVRMLSKYGGNKKEIIKYFGDHLKDCYDCKDLFEDYLLVAKNLLEGIELFFPEDIENLFLLIEKDQ